MIAAKMAGVSNGADAKLRTRRPRFAAKPRKYPEK
jgi:hypothetical protein